MAVTSDQAPLNESCADTIVTRPPRPPAAVPVLTPVGIIALVGLLSFNHISFIPTEKLAN